MTSARERLLQSKLYKAVLWITLFSMGGGTLLFTPNLFKKFSSRQGFASVNGVQLSEKEFQAQVALEYERIALIYQQLGAQAESLLKALGITDPREQALNAIIQNAVLDQVANKLDLRIEPSFLLQKLQDPSYVMNNLRSIVPVSVLEQNGKINIAALHNHLSRVGLTMADFEELLEKTLRRNILSNLVESSTYISPNEIKRYFVENYVPKKYAIVTFPLDKYLKEAKSSQVTDTVLEEFFKQENSKTKRYWIPEKRSALLWEFNPANYGSTITDAEIEQYYQQHKQHYLDKPAAIQIRRILFKIPENMAEAKAVEEKARNIQKQVKENPNQFAELARIHSDDKESAVKDGLIDFFSRGQKNPIVEKMAFRLQEDNSISDLFMSEEGIELIQRVARKAPTYKPFLTVRADIEKKLIKQKFSEQFNADIKPLLDQIGHTPTLLEEFARKKNAQKRTIAQKELDDTALMKKIFKTGQGQWTYLIDPESMGLVLQTTAIEKKQEPSFATVKQHVLQDYYQELARKRLAEALDKARTLAITQDIKTISETLGVKSEITDWLKKTDKEQWQSIEAKGLPVNELFALTDNNPVGISQNEKQGYLIKQIDSQKYSDEQLKEHQREIKAILDQEQQELIKRGYIASLYRNATIKSMKDSEFPYESEPLEEPL